MDSSTDPLTKTEQAAAKLLADRVLDGTEGPLQKLGGRCAAVTLQRWGCDLERDAGEQRWSGWEPCLSETAGDVLDHYADEDADVEGVDSPVFEGRPIGTDDLIEATEVVVKAVEQVDGFDRHEPGPMVERRST